LFRLRVQIRNHFFCVKNLFFTVAHDLLIFDVLSASVFGFLPIHEAHYLSKLLKSYLCYYSINRGHHCSIVWFQSIIKLLLDILYKTVDAIYEIQTVIKVKGSCILRPTVRFKKPILLDYRFLYQMGQKLWIALIGSDEVSIFIHQFKNLCVFFLISSVQLFNRYLAQAHHFSELVFFHFIIIVCVE